MKYRDSYILRYINRNNPPKVSFKQFTYWSGNMQTENIPCDIPELRKLRKRGNIHFMRSVGRPLFDTPPNINDLTMMLHFLPYRDRKLVHACAEKLGLKIVMLNNVDGYFDAKTLYNKRKRLGLLK